MAGVDVILDCIGAAYLQRNLDSLNFDGRLCLIGFQSGAVTEIKLNTLLPKRLTVQGTRKQKEHKAEDIFFRKYDKPHTPPQMHPPYPCFPFP